MKAMKHSAGTHRKAVRANFGGPVISASLAIHTIVRTKIKVSTTATDHGYTAPMASGVKTTRNRIPAVIMRSNQGIEMDCGAKVSLFSTVAPDYRGLR